MTLTVHTISGAPRPWRVLLGLTFKGLNYETHYLEASKAEHKAPAFLKLNPRGKVPVLETGDLILRDSIGILAWLDRQYPDRPLFGKTADEAARIWQVTMECCDYLRAAGQSLLFPILVLNEPLPAPDSDEMAALKVAGEAMHAECRYLETLLDGNSYLGGQHPSAADAIAFPEIRLIQRGLERKADHMAAAGFDNTAELYPRVAEWKVRVGALEGVDTTLPIHW
jgi:glutathione S-transferase